MGRFGTLQQWSDQAAAPEAPAGMSQAATAARAYEGANRFSTLGQWTSEQGYVGAAQSWYTGANAQGTNNGWDTDFYDRMFRQNERFGEEGKLNTQFEADNATGVVTWDHESSDGDKMFHFGDVYDKGKHVGNVFDQFDKDTANLMMADLLFDGKTKAEIYSDSDPMSRLNREVRDKHQSNNTEIPKALQAVEFNQDVKDRQAEFEAGGVDEAITAGGAVGGAVTGATAGAAAGSIIPGAGTLAGGIVGGLAGGAIGGVGAYLNQDALTEQAARAYEITAMSKAEHGPDAAIATGIQQWAGFGGKLISPLSNTVQGVTDWQRGDVGDGTSEFYRVDSKGQRAVPKWVQVADVAATVGDSAIQFASPTGVALYTTQMTGVIGGEVGELALTGGESFDYTRGGFDNIFTDDHGNFDASAGAAGIGKVGIDVVQLGMVRGLAGKVNASRLAAGEQTLFGRLPGIPSLAERIPGRGVTAEQRAALSAGGTHADVGGFKYVLDAEGKAVGPRRATLSLLAPSEQLGALSTRIVAMRAAGRRSGALTSDDFYRAANVMATGERKIATALVNGMGEGYEEAVQAILEPHSHGTSVTMDEIGSAALYGFAGGVGMNVGFNTRMPTADAKMFFQAQAAHFMRSGGVELTQSEWKSMTPTAKRAAAAMGQLERATAQAAYDKIASDQATEVNAGVVGANKLHDAVQTVLTQNMKKGTDRTDGVFVVTQIEDAGQVDSNGDVQPGSMPADAVGSSAGQLAVNLANHLRGVAIQLRYLEGEQKRLDAALTADPASQQAQEATTANQHLLDQVELALRWGQQVETQVTDAVTRMYDETATAATIQAEAETLNLILRDAFNMKTDSLGSVVLTPDDKLALARAVSQVFTRYPQDQAGSYQMLVPQVSAKLTMAKEHGHNMLEISHTILPAIRGDYDGDKVAPMNQVILDAEQFTSARSGAFFLGAGTSVNVGVPTYEKYQVEQIAESLVSDNIALSSYAAGTLAEIGTALQNRYAGVIDDNVLEPVLVLFYDAVRTNSKEARKVLLDGLALGAGTQIDAFARGNLSNEWLWIDQVIRSSFQRFQESYAAHRPGVGPDPNTDRVAPNRQSQQVRDSKATQAAVTGQTLALMTEGTDLFRKFQKLHYNSRRAPVLSAANAQDRDLLVEMAALYEELSSGVTQSDLDEIRSKDDITARVMVQLERLAANAKALNPQLSESEALVVIANMRVYDMEVDVDGVVLPNTRGSQISLTQMLLKKSVAIDRRAKDSIYELSKELQNKHERLLGMTRPGSKGKPVNAERAFVEVFGSQQLFSLLGDDAMVFGPHLTVEQFVREYVSMHEDERYRQDQKMHLEAAYLGRKRPKDLPYDLSEVLDKNGNPQISAFRAVVDSLTGVGHNRITMSDKGVLKGEYAEQSEKVGKAFRAAHRQARDAIYRFLELSPSSNELTVDIVQRVLEANPDFARQVMDLIPDSVAHAVFQVVGNDVYAANWVYTMFAESDSKHAEMHYWRNLLWAEWNAMGADTLINEEESTDGQKTKEFMRLKRRMHRVRWNLVASKDPNLIEQFITKLEAATDVDEFLLWVNMTPGLRGEQAPITAWVDDTAMFDPDKAGGGWTTSLAGTPLREAVSALQKGTAALVNDLREEKLAVDADTQTLMALRRVIRRNAGDTTTVLDPGDQDLYDKFEAALAEAAKQGMSLGPAAMIYQTVGAARGFYPQAHTKGKSPDNVDIQGQFDALRDAYDYVTNYERLLAALTSTNLDAVGGNLAQVARDGGRSMDDFGRPVEWERPSVEQMVDLLASPGTRPLARAVMFPQVMERTFDGRMQQQLLVGKDLKSLLDGTSHSDLFAQAGSLSHESALRYVAMVDATARRYGGHFDLQRAANDILIARTSAATHVLSTKELEQQAIEVYYEIAQVLQMTGAVAANVTDPDNDVLGELQTEVRKAQRVAALSSRLSLGIEDTEWSDALLEQLVSEREAEAEDEKREILRKDAATKDPAEKERYRTAVIGVDEQVRKFQEQVRLLLDDDMSARVVELYGYSDTMDEADKIDRQQVLVDYVLTNLSMIESASSELVTINKLTRKLTDSGLVGRVGMSDAEWTKISNAVVALHIGQIMVSPGANVAVTPFPDAEHAQDQRYYDVSFSYLSDPLLDPDSPLVQAAKHVHLLAGRFGEGETITTTDIRHLLERTLFKEFSLGRWTPEIPRSSIEANQRLDSASAASAIAMAGNSPKRQAVISATTRRTWLVPTDDLLSRSTLTMLELDLPEFEDINVEFPTGVEKRPLAQLNNRFAKSVTLRYTDPAGGPTPIEVDLFVADPNLPRPFASNEGANNSGLYGIHTTRVKRAVQVALADAGVDSSLVLGVDIEFLHPDSQPLDTPEDVAADRTWYNNVFFEGTSFLLNADRHESLTSTLWFANESVNPAAQAAALDAAKLGQPAHQTVDVTGAAERAVMEADWQTDFAGMLRAKTRELLESDMGFGKLDVEFYNAVYKDLKLRHFVRGKDADGKTALWTAEQVVDYQRTTPVDPATGVQPPIPLTELSLWIPTDDVLRSLLGEQGTQGVARMFPDQLEPDLSQAPLYAGVTDTMLSRFSHGLDGETTDISKTRVANRARQSVMPVRAHMTDAQRNAYDAKVRYFDEVRQEIQAQRTAWTGRTDVDGGFLPSRNLETVKTLAGDMLYSENMALDWNNGGISFFGPRKPADTELSRMVLHQLESALGPDAGLRTGWVYREGVESQPATGLISHVTLQNDNGGGALRVAPGDLVLVDLDSFNGDLDLMADRVKWLVGRNATIVLGSGRSQTYGRPETGAYLKSLGYERVVGSAHVYRPQDKSSRFQNVRARISSLTEVRGVSRRSMISTLLVKDKPIQENAAWVDMNNPRLQAIKVSLDLVPVDFLAGFNVPVGQFSNDSQIQKVTDHLRGMDTPEGRAMLLEQANKHLKGTARSEADTALEFAFGAMIRRFNENPGKVLPGPDQDFGTGDLIPLVDNYGRVLLYRHGYQAPDRTDVDKMMAEVLPGRTGAANVAIFPSKLEPAATTHHGRVIRFLPRSGYGLSVEMEIPLQVFGDKKVLEWNGMKYLLTPRPDDIVLPKYGIFPDWEVDVIANIDDTVSKESFEGLVNNHRNAFAFFGIDFTQDVADALGVDPARAVELLQLVAATTQGVQVEAADELINAPRLHASFTALLGQPAAAMADRVDPSWVDRIADPTTPSQQITAAIITYLATDGARVEDVLRSGGFNDPNSSIDAQSVLMPRLFTQLFDNAKFGSELRVEINKRLNQQLNNPYKDGTGYHLAEDFTFSVRNADPTKNLTGFLQFAEAHSSGDNPITNGMSFDEQQSQGISYHTAATTYQATGARTPFHYDVARARAFSEGTGIHRFDRDARDGGAWKLFTDVDTTAVTPWRSLTPGESSRMTLAAAAVVQFRQPLDMLDVHGWTDGPEGTRSVYKELRRGIVHQLGLKSKQAVLVDYWVRQMLGAPQGVDKDGNEVGWISGEAAVNVAKEISWNVQNRYLPTVTAMVPLMHVQDLQLIYRVNQHREKGWQPKESMDPDAIPATSWNEWVDVSLGSALLSDNLFDPLYLLATDGMMHTYQHATKSLLDMPVSLDSDKTRELLRDDMNRLLVSLDGDTELLAKDPVLLEVTRATLDELIGGRRTPTGFEAKAAPASEISKRRERIRQWRKETGMPAPVDVTMKNFRKNGADFVDKGSTTNAFYRILINLRVGTALINPALYVSMGPEQMIRGSIDRLANAMTLQGTVGVTSKIGAKVTAVTEGTTAGRALEALGLDHRYTPKQIKDLNRLYKTLGSRNDFKAMLFADLWYLRPHEIGVGKIERFFEGYAKLGSRMQDPTWGMRANTMARRYLDAVLQHLEANPTMDIVSVDQLIAHMRTNPTWLRDNHPEAHKAGSNAIAQLRSLKSTPLSMALKGIYEPMSESPNMAYNFLGNVVLKLPLLFSGYAANVMTTITGMQGVSDMFAMFRHGRKKGLIVRSFQAKMQGKELTEDEMYYNYEDVLEGIDLTRSFIRGGITHTGLFAMGLMAGGLGLSGEDDESKKRRRLAKLQGAGYIYDPRLIQNDFRNADALYFDWLPWNAGGGRDMVQMNWMVKQFLSPVMGMEKFYETGDWRQVMWGFQDAVGSFPLIQSLQWDDAVTTSAEFAKMADEQGRKDDKLSLTNAAGFLIQGAGVYERMLFENAFVNAIYIGKDKYDRDPYVLPLRDSDGKIQRDIEGEARANNLSVEDYITANRDRLTREIAGGDWQGQLYLDENTGEIKQGYLNRDDASAYLHSLTENRATMAFVSSLFTGGPNDSDYIRYNMPIKTREFDKPKLTQDESEALILGAYAGPQSKQMNLTQDEIASLIKADYVRRGVYYDSAEVDVMAAEAAKQQRPAALSINIDDREFLTEPGARAIFQGLSKGTVKFGDSALAGVHISFEMRESIQREWMKELVQDGVDLGLDQTKATSRMKRLWYGPLEDPSIQGLGDILWSKDISYTDTLKFNQLNTTYVMGPDGRPWATGFARDGLLTALGVRPFTKPLLSQQSITGQDDRLNTTYLGGGVAGGLNTGLRALEVINDSRYVPTDVEIGKSIEDAIKAAGAQDYTPYTPYAKTGSGYTPYHYSRYGGGGGYGGSGGYFSDGYANFSKMYGLPHARAPYGQDIPFINTTNPLIRRGDVRRERVWSERGRLKQWQ